MIFGGYLPHARAFVGFSAQIGDQPMGSLLGQARFLGDTETDLPARTPESIMRFCKNSQLTALSMGSTNIRFTDFTLIPPDSMVSAAVTVNQQVVYNLAPGQVVDLQNPLPIGDGIMLEALVPRPREQSTNGLRTRLLSGASRYT